MCQLTMKEAWVCVSVRIAATLTPHRAIHAGHGPGVCHLPFLQGTTGQSTLLRCSLSSFDAMTTWTLSTLKDQEHDDIACLMPKHPLYWVAGEILYHCDLGFARSMCVLMIEEHLSTHQMYVYAYGWEAAGLTRNLMRSSCACKRLMVAR